MNNFQNIVKYLLCSIILFYATKTLASPVLVYHPSVQIDNISKESLVRIYAMKQRNWADGSPVVVLILPKKNKTHKSFVNKFLKMHPHQLNRLWNRIIFSGVGLPPQEVSSEEDMLKKIAATPGSIGYIEKSTLQTLDVYDREVKFSD